MVEDFSSLFENPELYRCGENFSGSNIVFPVFYHRRRLVYKRTSLRERLSHTRNYARIKTGSFFVQREIIQFRSLGQEMKALDILSGFYAPKLVAYTRDALVREYIEGTLLRNLQGEEAQKRAIDRALQSMDALHGRCIYIGDPTPTNILFRANQRPVWIDFDMVHDSLDPKVCRKRDFTFLCYYVERDFCPAVSRYAKEQVGRIL